MIYKLLACKKSLVIVFPPEDLYFNCILPLLSVDSQRFDPSVPQGNTVWANNSGVALFVWRYTRRSTDASTTIDCYFETAGGNIDVLEKKNNNNPVVINNNQNTLRERLEAYSDPTDPTIFGFKLKRISKSDPKVYQCLAVYSLTGDQEELAKEFSKKLSLDVLGK